MVYSIYYSPASHTAIGLRSAIPCYTTYYSPASHTAIGLRSAIPCSELVALGASCLKVVGLVVGFQVEKVTAVGQSKSNNVWI
jgi:hypothetical protein